jgi:hypothetical protein
MLSATLLPNRASIGTTTTTKTTSPLSTSLVPASCPAGTSQASGLTCPEGHVTSGFTSKGVCCKRVYSTASSAYGPATDPTRVQVGPGQVPVGPAGSPAGPAQVPSGPATPNQDALLPPTFAPDPVSTRPKWLVPALIGGGVLVAGIAAFTIVKR